MRNTYQTALRCKRSNSAVVNVKGKGKENLSGILLGDDRKGIAVEASKRYLHGKISVSEGQKDKHSRRPPTRLCTSRCTGDMN